MRRALTLAVLCLAALGASPATAQRLAVCLYYDGDDNAADFRVGERSAVMVRNLLGHFKEVEVAMLPAGRYVPGTLARCDRAIYTGTYADGKLPDSFLSDAAEYRKPFLWMNYNIWKLRQKLGRETFAALWGFDYDRIDEGAQEKAGEIPRFYSRVSYKGANFRKVAELDENGVFIGDAAIVLVKNRSANVLAEAIHSGTGARTPYALRKGDFFYIADNPVSVIDERDRYLVLADLIFDVLKLEPRTQKRYALARIEDIHPAYDLKLLYQTIEVFKRRKLPFAMTLIPRYVGADNPGMDATQNVKFIRMIRYALENGASILVHGYEHQIGVDLGCGVTYSGEGYEFWDVCKNRPLPFDSEQFVQERLEKAKRILDDAKIPYAGWVTPHYAASETALRVIQRNFGRILQRVDYFLEGRPYSRANTVDQFFPYAIVNDYHGLYIWPENLGYLPLPTPGGSARPVDDILEAARLNKVVRDAWASFFWHPFLINTELGIASLEQLVDGIRAEGYEFVSLQELRKRGE
jgi:uncharacterized protein YdaL